MKHNGKIVNSNPGWLLLGFVAGLQTLSALMLLLFSGPGTFEADTGVAWETLTDVFPTVATQFANAQQASLVGTLGIGLFSLIVTYFAFRTGERWSWFAMWIMPLSMVPSTISLAITENQWGVAIFGGLLILVAIIGLFLGRGNLNHQPHRS